MRYSPCLTVASHSAGETLLQPAVLASVTMVLGHFAVFGPPALVSQLLADRPLEEALASLAADGPVVPAGSSVPTNNAQLHRETYVVRTVPAVLLAQDVDLHVLYLEFHVLFHGWQPGTPKST